MVTFLIDRAVRLMQRGSSESSARSMASFARRAWYRESGVAESETDFGGGLLYHLQGKRLRSTIRHAAAHSPYYRGLFDASNISVRDIRDAGDLRSLPFTDQKEMGDWNRFISVPLEALESSVTSAGTFGDPKTIVFTAKDWNQVCTARAVALGSDLRRTQYLGSHSALVFGPGEDESWADVLSTTDALRRLGMDVMRYPASSVDDAAAWVEESRPSVVAGYPLSLYELTEAVQIRGSDHAASMIVCLGGPCPDDIRERLEAHWQCAVRTDYGSAEVGGPQTIAFAGCRGYHLNNLDFLWEVIDPDTGESAHMGELVVTTLLRSAMPLIRYRTGDLVRLTPHDCRIPFPAVEILGPDDEFLWEGKRVSAPDLSAVLRREAGVPGKLSILLDSADGTEVLHLSVEGNDGSSAGVARVRAVLGERFPDIFPAHQARGRVEISLHGHLDRQPKSYRVIDRRH